MSGYVRGPVSLARGIGAKSGWERPAHTCTRAHAHKRKHAHKHRHRQARSGRSGHTPRRHARGCGTHPLADTLEVKNTVTRPQAHAPPCRTTLHLFVGSLP
eukprot:358738-Chlamydomonas_euryale.AAC.1